jgi:hypothetical protein
MQASDVDWGRVESYDLGFCLAFARGVSEEGMLAAYGCEPGAARVLTHEQMLADEAYEDWVDDEFCYPFVRVGRVGEWSFGFEESGMSVEGSRDEVIQHFPPGTETVSYFRVNAFSWFRHTVDGATVTDFEPLRPYDRSGSDSDRLVPLMRRVGLNPDGRIGIDLERINPTLAALGLMTEAWGLYIDRDTINGPLLTAWFHARPRTPVPGAQPPQETPAVVLELGQPGPAGSVAGPLRPPD